jgi:hypothetical protein
VALIASHRIASHTSKALVDAVGDPSFLLLLLLLLRLCLLCLSEQSNYQQ